MADLTASERRWIKAMELCRKYCGCHQMHQRSFFIHGYQFPLCARCTGIATGYLTAAILAPFIRIPFASLLLIVPMAVDGTVQLLTAYESTNQKRFITGFLFGFAALACAIRLIALVVSKSLN